MTKPVVYLDLDRTLYRTDEAAVQIWRQVASLYPAIDADREYARGALFHVTAPNGLYYYDFTAHLQDCGLDPHSIYAALVVSPLTDNRLLVAGAQELVAWLNAHAQPALLTYGSEDYQRLKIALCPALKNLPAFITLKPKAEWLEGKGACWLVDDKALGDELPATVQFVQVSLEGRKFTPSDTWPQCTSLEAVRQYLEQNLQ